jgi:hypothetical protein
VNAGGRLSLKEMPVFTVDEATIMGVEETYLPATLS